jgi:hypothetical protein
MYDAGVSNLQEAWVWIFDLIFLWFMDSLVLGSLVL